MKHPRTRRAPRERPRLRERKALAPSRECNERRRHPEEYPVPDPKDATTPDAWVKRAPELVRLTGRHPFNVEPPLPMLIAHGHSTPASLHYVRNHGKVPVVYSDATADQVERDWRCELLSGHGVTKSASLSLEDLKALPKVRLRRPFRFRARASMASARTLASTSS